MPVGDTSETRTRRGTLAVVVVVVAVLAPLALLAVLRLRPALDALWQNHPAHFSLVLAAAVIATTLGYTVTAASRRRRDARLFMVSMAFIAAAGGLGLHALATPGVLVGPNAGFELATPVGLVVGGVFAALSAIELAPTTAQRIMAGSRLIMTALFALIVVWALLSVAQLPPLADAVPQEQLGGWQLAFAVAGVVGYAAGAWGGGGTCGCTSAGGRRSCSRSPWRSRCSPPPWSS